MLTYTKRTVLVLLASVLGFATTAEAGPWMYSGEIIIHAFGNDTTTATKGPYYTWWPFSTYVNPVFPFGYNCNTVWPNSTSPWGTDCGTVATKFDHQRGLPLTGTGAANVTGSSPASFSLSASDMSRVTDGSFRYYFPYLYTLLHADLKNRAGGFFGGGGPGNFTFPYQASEGTVAKVAVKKGPNQFGGTMRLLGSVTAHEAYYWKGRIWRRTIDWLFDNVGGTAIKTTGGYVTGGYTDTDIAHFYNAHSPPPETTTVTVTAFSWTTGTATATAFYRGPLPSHMQRKGYDNRTALGKGAIQLVAPGLTHWRTTRHQHQWDTGIRCRSGS